MLWKRREGIQAAKATDKTNGVEDRKGMVVAMVLGAFRSILLVLGSIKSVSLDTPLFVCRALPVELISQGIAKQTQRQMQGQS